MTRNTNPKQDQDVSGAIAEKVSEMLVEKLLEASGSEIVEAVVETIGGKLTLDQVFEDEEIIDYVAGAFSVDEVFDEKRLAAWAEANWYTKGGVA